MGINEIIQKIATFCQKFHAVDSEEYALQRFVEELILPPDVEYYTEDEFKNYARQALDRVGYSGDIRYDIP